MQKKVEKKCGKETLSGKKMEVGRERGREIETVLCRASLDTAARTQPHKRTTKQLNRNNGQPLNDFSKLTWGETSIN